MNAYLNTKAHASYSALAAFLEDVCQDPVSRGEIAKTLQRVSEALEKTYTEAVESLRGEAVLTIDETGHREKGKRFWTGFSEPGIRLFFTLTGNAPPKSLPPYLAAPRPRRRRKTSPNASKKTAIRVSASSPIPWSSQPTTGRNKPSGRW